MENNNTIDMQNESLEDAALSYSNLFDFPNEELSKVCFKKGANWQQQKDKAVIDKLTQALKDLVLCVDYKIYSAPAIKGQFVNAAKQLLQSIEKETL